MEELRLIMPSPECKDQIMDYKREFAENHDSMDGTAGLSKTDDFAEWYQALLDNRTEETVHSGLVPASTYLAILPSTGRLVGFIDIRHRLNDYLLQSGGHIGYSIRKSERRKGYAAEMLRLGLEKCRELGLQRVLLTCDKENEASARTMLKNGAVLENEVMEGNRVTRRYWISLIEVD